MTSQQGKGSITLAQKLENFLTPAVRDLGYEIIDLECVKQPGGEPGIVRLFIDHAEPRRSELDRPIGIEDCVAVDRGVSELLETPEFNAIHPGEFTLEVSSPGIDRRLRTTRHFLAHIGKTVRVRTFRALDAEELANSRYHEDNPKQKNFIGTLVSASHEAICLRIDANDVSVPMSMIAKANLNLADEVLRASNGKIRK